MYGNGGSFHALAFFLRMRCVFKGLFFLLCDLTIGEGHFISASGDDVRR